MRHQRAFTLIELMVVVAVMAVLAVLAAPSLRDFIELQRLRSVSSALTTDLQFARSEAAARNRPVYVRFESDTSYTCYALFTGSSETDCSCRNGVGTACTGNAQEVRTVRIDKSLRTQVVIPEELSAASRFTTWLAFDPTTGSTRIQPSSSSRVTCPDFTAEARGNTQGHLRTSVNPAGRLHVCSPATAPVGGVPVCAPRVAPC